MGLMRPRHRLILHRTVQTIGATLLALIILYGVFCGLPYSQ